MASRASASVAKLAIQCTFSPIAGAAQPTDRDTVSPDFTVEIVEVRDFGDRTLTELKARGHGAGSHVLVEQTVAGERGADASGLRRVHPARSGRVPTSLTPAARLLQGLRRGRCRS